MRTNKKKSGIGTYVALTSLVNGIFRSKKMPARVASSRLFCLNKDPPSLPRLSKLRPIAISSVLYKLIEAVILPDIKQNLGKLHPAQVGFIKAGETGMNLLRLTAKLKEIQGRPGTSNKYFLTFVDFRAAFDRVNHKKLLSKARSFGISDNSLNVIRLLYNHASLSVGKESIPINRGVPQGSLISPFMFNIYIDDLLVSLGKLIGDDNVMAYADDLLFITCGRLETETAISILRGWCVENEMEVNQDKTKILVLCKKKGLKTLNIKRLGDYEIVSEYKYLGITIDCSLTLDGYITLLKNKLKSFQMNIPKLLVNAISLKVRLELWKVFALSHLAYVPGLLAIVPSKMKAFSTIYLKSLKQACKLHVNTETSIALRMLEVWGPKTVVLHSYSRLLRKLKAQGHLTRPLINHWPKFASASKIREDLLELDGEEYRAALEHYNHLEVGQDPSIEMTLKIAEILEDGDARDSYFVKFVTGGILDMQKYVYGNKYGLLNNLCPTCPVAGTQKHFLEDCQLMQDERDELQRTLAKEGLDIGKVGLFGFVRNIKSQPIWKRIGKDERGRLISMVKDFVFHLHSKVKERLLQQVSLPGEKTAPQGNQV